MSDSCYEWDAERWGDRRELLATMWLHSEAEENRKRLIADLIIHSHDVSE